jgi:nucleotide-binding universal stress UspA family protein
MTIRHILVHAETGRAAEQRLRYAISLASSYESRLTGLSVRPSPGSIAFSMMGDPQAYAAVSEECDKTCLEAAKLFAEVTEGCGLTVDWREASGVAAEVIAAEAACADLVMLSKVATDDASGPVFDVQPADVVLACGRPVLVVPSRPPPEFHARRILLAWKSTAQAARAAHDALPLMIGAEQVIVAEVASSPSAFGYEVGADMMADYLRMHDLKVSVVTLDPSGDAGECLVTAARDQDCDLIVAGAYGHSRTREWVLGGVTRTLLNADTPPLLLSH